MTTEWFRLKGPKRYLCELPSAYGYRRWVEAEGPSQAAISCAEKMVLDGTAKVLVYNEEETYMFDVTVRVGQPSSVRWVRDWSEVV